DFSNRVFGALHGALAFGTAAADGDHVHQRTAVEENAVREFLHFGVDFLDQLLAVDGSAQQGFERGKKGLRVLQGKSARGHLSYSNAWEWRRWGTPGTLLEGQ